MATVAAYGGSGIGMGGGSSSSDEGDNDKRMRVVTDFVPSSDEDGEETDEEVAEITESKVVRPNSDLRNLTLNDDDLPPKLRHKRKMASKDDIGLPPKLRHKRKMALNDDDLPPKLHKRKYDLIGKSRSTENLKRMGVSVKKSRVRTEIITRASSEPIRALPPHLAEDSDQEQEVDILGVSDEDDEINQNPTGVVVDVGKKKKKNKNKNKKSKKRSKK